MFERVVISAESKNLIKKLEDAGVARLDVFANEDIEREILVAWLNQKSTLNPSENKKYAYLLDCLHASLLSDLNMRFLTEDQRNKIVPEKKKRWYKSAKFILLMIAGSLIAICEGFDGIASILGLVASVPTLVLFLVGAGFAVLSVMIFCLANLVSISNTMNVSLRQSRHILDVLVENSNQLKLLEISLLRYHAQVTTPDDNQALQSMAAMLKIRYDAFIIERDNYVNHLKKPGVVVAKKIASFITGAILSAGVFFSCQTISLAIGGLFVASIAATFWPIVLTCALMSLIAFAFFWTTGRHELDDQVAHWMGQDPEKITELTADNDIVKTTDDLIAKCQRMSSPPKIQDAQTQEYFAPVLLGSARDHPNVMPGSQDSAQLSCARS
jgi:hypothetical protein